MAKSSFTKGLEEYIVYHNDDRIKSRLKGKNSVQSEFFSIIYCQLFRCSSVFSLSPPK
ncbi:IS3 family transposase [Porphyromonas macacae]|uniref:IS3 family transposase n=1 Tax=Porphyromonas macacae TaxID=28115 RepID=UPI0037422E87